MEFSEKFQWTRDHEDPNGVIPNLNISLSYWERNLFVNSTVVKRNKANSPRKPIPSVQKPCTARTCLVSTGTANRVHLSLLSEVLDVTRVVQEWSSIQAALDQSVSEENGLQNHQVTLGFALYNITQRDWTDWFWCTSRNYVLGHSSWRILISLAPSEKFKKVNMNCWRVFSGKRGNDFVDEDPSAAGNIKQVFSFGLDLPGFTFVGNWAFQHPEIHPVSTGELPKGLTRRFCFNCLLYCFSKKASKFVCTFLTHFHRGWAESVCLWPISAFWPSQPKDSNWCGLQ